MIDHYIASSFKALRNDRLHAAINVLGLAVALAVCLLIALYVRYELSYENIFTDPDRVYRLETLVDLIGQSSSASPVIAPAAEQFVESDFSAFLVNTAFYRTSLVISSGENFFRETVIFASKTLFDVLDFPIMAGDAPAALGEPTSAILSERMANKLFGTTDVLGSIFRVDGEHDHVVAAVIKDVPSNSDFDDIDIILSMESAAKPENTGAIMSHWGNMNARAYVRLKPGVDLMDIASQLPDFAKRHVPPEVASFVTINFMLRRLTDIHLYAQGPANFPSAHNAIATFSLAATAFVLIVIACFNYVMLTTARSLLRIREVGLRKVMGAARRQIMLQFLCETAVITTLAFILAIALATVALPAFSILTDRALTFSLLTDGEFLVASLLFVISISIIAGAYPAFYASAIKPSKLLVQGQDGVAGSSSSRGFLVAVQFSLTIALVIVAAVIFAQTNYARNLDLGFDKEQFLIVNRLGGIEPGRMNPFIAELENSPGVSKVTASTRAPSEMGGMVMKLRLPGETAEQEKFTSYQFVRDDFFDVYDIELLSGRRFSVERPADIAAFPTPEKAENQSGAILNQSATRFYGLGSPQEAIGKTLRVYGGDGHTEFTVIGVVADFHIGLGRSTIEPWAFYFNPDVAGELTVRFSPNKSEAALDSLKKLWSRMFPDRPLSYEFLNERFQALYADNARQSKLFIALSGLAIFIACLGLYAQAAYATIRRTQEVAIRKVCGASTTTIVGLLVADFSKPVLLANVIAWPVTWYFLQGWLDAIPYRIDLSIWFFLGGGLLALTVACATVATNALHAARTKPAIALRRQ